MAGQGSSEYRPRRALPPEDDDFDEDDAVASDPPSDAASSAEAAHDRADDDTAELSSTAITPSSGTPSSGTPSSRAPVSPGYRSGAQPGSDPGQPIVEADEPIKPLYRDEIDPSEAPTLTATGGYGRAPSSRRSDHDLEDDALADLDELDEGPGLGQRGKLALLIGVIAAVVVLGLAIGYAVVGRPDNPSSNPTADPPAPPTASGTTAGTPTTTNGGLLTAEMLIAAADAKPIDADRDWKVSQTITTLDENSPQAICLGVSIEGMPTAREAMIQLLESTGNLPPAILHQASVYNTADEAAQAYALVAKAIGDCSAEGQQAWIYSGRVITGLGDQSLGTVIKIEQDDEEFRSVILARTGRILNVVDVAKQQEGVSVSSAVRTVAAAINRQCAAGGGDCAKDYADKAGPPPVGDQPGYLSAGDLPPPSKTAGAWFADQSQNLTDVQHGSGCETADMSKIAGGRAVERTFLLEGDAGNFGLDQYVVTLKSPTQARRLVAKFVADWKSCRERRVTPTVTDPTAIQGVGAKDAAIAGWVSAIKVPTGNSDSRTYRVGVASVGTKVVYTFLSPTDALDLSEAEWKRVTVRTAERATQVS